MPVIEVAGGKTRPEYVRRVFRSWLDNGQTLVSAWPKTRKWRKTIAQLQREAWLAQLVDLQKYQNSYELQTMRDSIKSWNDSMRGQRGSAAVRQEDYFFALLAGTLFAVMFPDGTSWWPARVAQQVSYLLDWLEPYCGGVLMCGAAGWGTTIQCEATTAPLCLLPDIAIDQACALGGNAPAQYSPPSIPSDTQRRLIVDAAQLVQDLLNVLGSTPGMILYRDQDRWRALPPGAIGDILVLGTNYLPQWKS